MKIKPVLLMILTMLIMMFSSSVFAAGDDAPILRDLESLGLNSNTKIYVHSKSEQPYEKEWRGLITTDRVEPLIKLLGTNPVEFFRGKGQKYTEEGYLVNGYSPNIPEESIEYTKYNFEITRTEQIVDSNGGYDIKYQLYRTINGIRSLVDEVIRKVRYDKEPNYSVNGTYFEKLEEAYNYIIENGSTGTIIVEQDNTDPSNFIVERGKNITINTNGKVVTKTLYGLENNGTLTIDGTGTIQTANADTNTIATLITNNGTLNIKNGNLIHNGHKTEYWYVIADSSSSHTTRSTINISGGKISATLSDGVTAKYSARTILLQNATLNMTDGRVEAVVDSTRTTDNKISVGIELYADGYVPTLNISRGTVEVTGGYGIYNNSDTGPENAAGKINITGGNISGSAYGIYDITGNITLGTKGNGVKETPVITGGEYGLYIRNGNENAFTFYDGIIKGKTAPYNGDFTDTKILKEDGYGIDLGTDGEYKTAKLSPGNYRVGNEYYMKMQEANEGTWESKVNIITLKSNTDNSEFIVPAEKEVTLDTNGQTITKTEAGLVNNGTLNIIGTGTITNTGSIMHLIENNGNLDLNNLTIKHITGQNNDIYILIENKTGTTNINNAKLQIENVSTLASGYTSSRVIEVRNGTLNINGGTIENNGNGTQEMIISTWTNNNAKKEININDGILKSKSGMGLAIDSVDNTENHIEINIANGEITTANRSIWLSNEFCGKLNVKGGSIRSKNAFAIQNDGTGDVVIGTKDGKVSKTNPSITGKTYSVQSQNGFEFYDGILKGTESAYYGSMPVVEVGCGIKYGQETIDGALYETAVLEPLITGKVEIEGPNIVGGTLKANVTVEPEDAELEYKWFLSDDTGTANAVEIPGVTGDTYQITDDAIGKHVFVEVTAKREGYVDNKFYDSTDSEHNRFETVVESDISHGKLTLNPITFVYNGKEHTPDTIVVLNNETLVVGRDYTVEYKNNINVGDFTASATVTGIAPFKGQLTEKFSITPKPLNGRVELSENSYEFDGTPKEPKVVVVDDDGKILEEGVDYELEYEDNTDAGTAKVVVKGKGNYEGVLEESFEITKKGLTLRLENKLTPYTGNVIEIEKATIGNCYESDLEALQNSVVYYYYTQDEQDIPMNSEDANNLPIEPGVYYVQATITGQKNYKDVTSNKATLVIYSGPTDPKIIGKNVNGTIVPSGSSVSNNVNVSVYGSTMLNVEMIPGAQEIKIGYKYSKDNKTWSEYTGQIIISEEGTTTIYVKAYVVGHEELESNVVEYTVTIDKTPPTLNPDDVIIPDEVNGPVIEPGISGDGIYEVYITEDPDDDPTKGDPKGDWKQVGDDDSIITELTPGDGEKDLNVWVRDEAGNITGPIKKKTTVNALKLGNNKDNKTTISFKVSDEYLHDTDIKTENIKLYVDNQLSAGRATSIKKEQISEKEYRYRIIIENVDLDGALGVGLVSDDIKDKAGNTVSESNRRVPTNEITVDNTMPQVNISTNDNKVYIIASDEHMKAITLNGKIIGRTSGQYEAELRLGKNKVVVTDDYGNDVSQEITYEEVED